MDTPDNTPRLNTQILEEAAEWLIEFNSEHPEPHARDKFDTWLRMSPEHVRAYLELLPIWEDGASLPLGAHTSADKLIELGKKPDTNIIELGTIGIDSPVKRMAGFGLFAPHERRRIAAAWYALAASIALAVFGAWFVTQRGVYTTDIGEQRSVTLEDGSTISLNARSRVRVRFTDAQRNVELIAGQALFHVAKNPARPFIVKSDHTQVRAVGTQFDVNRRKVATIVTVVEGTVAVHSGAEGSSSTFSGRASAQPTPPSATTDSALPSPREGRGAAAEGLSAESLNGELLLTAGEQTTVIGTATPHAVRTNVANITAWAQRRLVFDASTLGEVIDEFNRYNTRQLVLRDRSLETFPITAAFSSTDPTSLVHFLRAQPGIHVAESGDEIQVSSRH
jgi:transmembrane sensor